MGLAFTAERHSENTTKIGHRYRRFGLTAAIAVVLVPVLSCGLVGPAAAATPATSATGSLLQAAAAKVPTKVSLASTANPALVGSQVSYVATIAGQSPASGALPTGTVNFLADGSLIGSGSLSAAGVASYSASPDVVGSSAITAQYQGDTTFAGATSTPLTQVLSGIPTSIALDSTDGETYIQDSTLYAGVSSKTHVDDVGATGEVDFYFDGAMFGGSFAYSNGLAMLLDRTLPLGTHVVQAFYRGNSQYLASSSAKVTLLVVPDQAPTVVTLTANPTSAKHGRQVVFTAAASSTTDSSPVTSGQIRFLVNGVQVQAPQDVGPGGTVTFSTRALPTGRPTVSAEYLGTADYLASSASRTYWVAMESTSTTLLASSGLATGQPGTVTASIRGEHGAVSTGSVTFTVDGKSRTPVLLDAHGSAALALAGLTPGSHTVSASYSGTNNYTSSTAQLTVPVSG